MGNLSQFFGGGAFDPNSVPPDCIPGGNYTLHINEAELKATKSGNGHYIEIQLQVIDECQFKGKVLFDRMNIDNPNSQAVAIAQRSLGALGVAAGIPSLDDTSLLRGKVVIGAVKEKDGENSIRTYKAPVQAQAAVPAPAPQYATQTAQTAVQPPVAPVMPAQQQAVSPAVNTAQAVGPAPAPVQPQYVAPAAQQQPSAAPPWARTPQQ